MKPFRFVGLALIIVILLGCAGGQRGTLTLVKSPTESELKQDWKNYEVYFRPGIALVYKTKDGQKIILDERWIRVTTEEIMAGIRINDSVWVKKIVGQNDRMFGYLVHRSADNTNVKIIDANTVQLYYHYVRTSGR